MRTAGNCCPSPATDSSTGEFLSINVSTMSAPCFVCTLPELCSAQGNVWGHRATGRAVVGHQPAQQCHQNQVPPLHCAARRNPSAGEPQQHHHPDLHQPECPQAAAGTSHTHVPQCECATLDAKEDSVSIMSSISVSCIFKGVPAD